MQGLMLAAGMGKRLVEYTNGNTKCMVKVGEHTLIERAIYSLKKVGINKLIMVVGYKSQNLIKFLKDKVKDIEIIFIENPVYETTNNIYSMYLAKEWLEKDDTILLESDLIYEPQLIKEIVEMESPNVALVAKYEEWMDGTVVTIDSEENIKQFIEKKEIQSNREEYYKTINIYKFSKDFSKDVYIPFLKAFMDVYGKNEYYELALKIIACLNRTNIKAKVIEDIKWYEIDNGNDLKEAEKLFNN